MRRRSEDVATRRPLRRFERRAGRRWTPESLPSFRAPFPVADSIFSVACGAISFRPGGGSRLKSDSLEYLALLPTDASRAGNNLVAILLIIPVFLDCEADALAKRHGDFL
jgi:hypothetical protein